MGVVLFLSLLLQPPAAAPKNPQPQPQHRHIPPYTQWHQWHGRPLVAFNAVLPSPVVVVPNADAVIATVDNAGNIITTYRLVPVVSAPPVVVVPEVRRGFIFGSRYRWSR